MASPSSSKSEPAIIEQVITEFFAKSVHIILESRSPYVSSRNYSAGPFISSPSSSSSSLSFRPRDKWFNLALRDCPAALENFDLWRQSNLEPLVVDVILSDRKSVRNVGFPSPGGFLVRNLSSGRDEIVRENKSEKIVERWIVQYDSQSSSWFTRESSHQVRKKGSRAASGSSEFEVMYKKAYRRIIVLLRSLYAAVRLLPTYKLFRDLNASGQIQPMSLCHRILSVVHPFSREEDAEMNQLGFGPLDTFFGKLSLSVTYLKKIEFVGSEPSTPISTQFILDYVGSPLADPLKRFQSLPYSGSAPSCAALGRRHSWSNDHGEIPSFSLTPSPAYSDSRALNNNLNPRLPPNHLLDTFSSPCSLPKGSYAGYTKIFDEYRPSPPFSPSSSLSSPSHLSKALIRSESAPVSIPLPGQKGRSGGQIQGLPRPYSNSKRQGCSSQADSIGTELSTTSTPQTFSPENKLQLKKESLRLVEWQTRMSLPKIFSSGKDHAENLSILKVPSYTSSHIPSRSSSRLSFMDEFDDSGFTCPFAEDDEEVSNSYWVESADCKDHAGENLGPGELVPIKRSPDAAVGALVRMLRTAPPLQLDNSITTLRTMQVFRDEISNKKIQQEKENNEENDVGKVDSSSHLDVTASELLKSRTAADALEELQTYKHMKELILKQGGSLLQDIEDAAISNVGDPTEV